MLFIPLGVPSQCALENSPSRRARQHRDRLFSTSHCVRCAGHMKYGCDSTSRSAKLCPKEHSRYCLVAANMGQRPINDRGPAHGQKGGFPLHRSLELAVGHEDRSLGVKLQAFEVLL